MNIMSVKNISLQTYNEYRDIIGVRDVKLTLLPCDVDQFYYVVNIQIINSSL